MLKFSICLLLAVSAPVAVAHPAIIAPLVTLPVLLTAVSVAMEAEITNEKEVAGPTSLNASVTGCDEFLAQCKVDARGRQTLIDDAIAEMKASYLDSLKALPAPAPVRIPAQPRAAFKGQERTPGVASAQWEQFKRQQAAKAPVLTEAQRLKIEQRNQLLDAAKARMSGN